MRNDLLTTGTGKTKQRLLRNRQHSTGSTCTVIQQVRSRLDGVGRRQEDKVCHQLHCVSWRPVFACLFVVFLVELANKFLEDGTHCVIVHPRMLDRAIAVQYGFWAEVDLRVEELFN